MNKSKFLISIFIIFLFAFSFSVKAQDNLRGDAAEQSARGGNLMRMLGLTTDQIQQIRRLNQARKPLERDARHRIVEARQNLDRAVYADNLNESDVQARLLELQQAQTELTQIRASNELEIRKILTNEQLIKFRELRRQFEERKKSRVDERRQRRMKAPNSRPLKRRQP